MRAALRCLRCCCCRKGTFQPAARIFETSTLRYSSVMPSSARRSRAGAPVAHRATIRSRCSLNARETQSAHTDPDTSFIPQPGHEPDRLRRRPDYVRSVVDMSFLRSGPASSAAIAPRASAARRRRPRSRRGPGAFEPAPQAADAVGELLFGALSDRPAARLTDQLLYAASVPRVLDRRRVERDDFEGRDARSRDRDR